MAKSAIIILARHGTTEYNQQENTLRGWTDVPLNEKGNREAQACADEIKENWPNVEKLYCANLSRAIESAQYIERAIGPSYFETLGLRPWNPGELAGRAVPDLGQVLHYYINNPDEAPKGGESINTFKTRLLKFMSETIAEAEMGLSPIICVTSIRPIQVIIGWLEAGMQGKKIDSSYLAAKGDEVQPGGLVVLTRNGKKEWDYEIHEVDTDDNEGYPDSPSERPVAVTSQRFGRY